MEDTDDAAVARALSGDGDAFGGLVQRHSRSVFRLAYRMTGNEQDAEDIVQETFLRAYRQLARYESRSSFSTWLYRIAANCSLDLIRSRKHARPAPAGPDDETDWMATLPAPDPGPDRLAFSGQVQDRVARAMNTLSEMERASFVLRHFEGHSIEEISGLLGVGASAAKHSIFRAVQKLRKALEPMVSAG